MRKIYYCLFCMILFGITGMACHLNLRTESTAREAFSRTFKEYDLYKVDLQPADGGFIIVGEDELNGDHQDIMALRVNGKGEKIWEQIYDLGRDDGACAVDVTSDGYVIAGFSGAYSRGARDALIMRIDQRGKLLWVNTFGGHRDDYATAIKTVKDGYIVAGYTKQRGPQGISYWLAKLDSQGELLWEKFFGKHFINYAKYLFIHKNECTVVGSTSNGRGEWESYLVTTDLEGKLQWEKIIKEETLISAAASKSGIVLLTSPRAKSSLSRLQQLRTDGTVAWKKDLPDEIHGTPAGVTTSDNHVYLFGHHFHESATTITVTSFNGEGRLLEKKSFEEDGDFRIEKVCSLPDGFVLAGTGRDPVTRNLALRLINRKWECKQTAVTSFKVSPQSKRELQYAVIANDTVMLEKLLNQGADSNTVFADSTTPLYLAAYKGNLASVKVLLGHKALVSNEGIYAKNSLLHAAAHGGLSWLVERLYEQYPEIYRSQVNACNHYKQTPLGIAVEKNNIKLVTFFLAHGADVNVAGEDRPLLHVAVQNKNSELVKLLLEKGADSNRVSSSEHKTALHYAIENNDLEMVRLLLSHNADVHVKDRNGATPLHYAVPGSEEAICKLLLQQGAEVNVTYTTGRYKELTPLHLALLKEKKKVFRLLLQYHADIHKPLIALSGWYGRQKEEPWPLLAYAICNKEGEIANMLIDAGADISAPVVHSSQETTTPLHLAIQYRQMAVVMNLLYHGADPEHKVAHPYYGKVSAVELAKKEGLNMLFPDVLSDEERRNQQLEHALQQRDYRKAKDALSRGADVHYQAPAPSGYNGTWSMLDFAVDSGELRLVTLITERLRADKSLSYPSRAFDLAIRKKKHAIFMYLYRNFKQTFSRYSEPSMATAVFSHNGSVLRFLLEQHHKIEHVAFNGDTLLNFAMQADEPLMAQTVRQATDLRPIDKQLYTSIYRDSYSGITRALKGGANINVKDIGGITPLCWAAFIGHFNVVRFLLKHGAQIEDTKSYGDKSPLFWAAARGNVEVVRLLLEHGANMEVSDHRGMQPLHVAALHGHAKVVEVLLREGADINEQAMPNGLPVRAMHLAAEHGKINVIKTLLAGGQSVDVYNHKYYQETALLFAVQYGQYDTIDFLLKKGADINTVPQNKSSCLHRAAYNGNRDIARLLREHGARLNLVDNSGNTPFMIALKEGKVSFARYLLEEGASVTTVDSSGNTTLHIAAREGLEHIALKLLQAGVDVNSCNNDDLSPLHYAVLHHQRKLVALLLQHKASLNRVIAKGRYKGKTALDLAESYAVWKLLRDAGAHSAEK